MSLLDLPISVQEKILGYLERNDIKSAEELYDSALKVNKLNRV